MTGGGSCLPFEEPEGWVGGNAFEHHHNEDCQPILVKNTGKDGCNISPDYILDIREGQWTIHRPNVDLQISLTRSLGVYPVTHTSSGPNCHHLQCELHIPSCLSTSKIMAIMVTPPIQGSDQSQHLDEF